MAAKEKKLLSPEEKKREQERIDREKREKKIQKQRLQEKERKKKERYARKKKKERDEMKRIRSIINLPFKLLLQVTALVTSMSFILIYFGTDIGLPKAIFYCFLIFTLIYLGGGSIMVGVFWMISIEKEKEMMELQRVEEEEKRNAEENRAAEEQRREEERKEAERQRIARQEQLARELVGKRNEPQPSVDSDDGMMMMPMSEPISSPMDLEDDMPMGDMKFDNFSFDDDDEILKQEAKKMSANARSMNAGFDDFDNFK